MYANGPIMWRCQRQPFVTLSSTEAEYVSGWELTQEPIPLREHTIELGQIDDEPVQVYIDDQSTVKIAKNEGGQQRTKHIYDSDTETLTPITFYIALASICIIAFAPFIAPSPRITSRHDETPQRIEIQNHSQKEAVAAANIFIFVAIAIAIANSN